MARWSESRPRARALSAESTLQRPFLTRRLAANCCVIVCLVLVACENDGGRLSIAEGLKCATEAFSDRAGRFSLGENAIAYTNETANGPARVIVVFDGRRRPVRTFFESAPHGSHPVLMDAARVIKDCVAYGPKARREEDKGGATSMRGK